MATVTIRMQKMHGCFPRQGSAAYLEVLTQMSAEDGRAVIAELQKHFTDEELGIEVKEPA